MATANSEANLIKLYSSDRLRPHNGVEDPELRNPNQLGLGKERTAPQALAECEVVLTVERQDRSTADISIQCLPPNPSIRCRGTSRIPHHTLSTAFLAGQR